jgi:hypothetical protein
MSTKIAKATGRQIVAAIKAYPNRKSRLSKNDHDKIRAIIKEQFDVEIATSTFKVYLQRAKSGEPPARGGLP